MELRYVGPSKDGVEQRMPDGSETHVPFNGKLETTSEHADELLARADGSWQKWATPSAKTSSSTGKEG